jgi:hypothetical protein
MILKGLIDNEEKIIALANCIANSIAVVLQLPKYCKKF